MALDCTVRKHDPTGYQDVPWNEGEYTCVIRQYTLVVDYRDGR